MLKDYWRKSHEMFSKDERANKVSEFAQFAVGYFPHNGKLLDLGAGRGQDSRYFANLGYDVTSADISDLGLRLSAEKTGGDLKIKFLELDIADGLPFEDNSFDVVYARYSLHYFLDEKTKEIFREIYRALKPQGILACLINSSKDAEAVNPKNELIEKDYYKSSSGLLTRYFSTEYLKMVIENLFMPIILNDGVEVYDGREKKFIRFVGKVDKQGKR
jgi:ubiquinone/menaquinone biosynthesis C-methylase UbiE